MPLKNNLLHYISIGIGVLLPLRSSFLSSFIPIESFSILLGIGILLVFIQLLRSLPILMFFVFLGILSVIFPPLGILITIAIIVMILMRLAYIFKHFALICLGFLYYGFVFWADTGMIGLVESISDVVSLAEDICIYIVAIVLWAILEVIFQHAYRHGYRTSQIVEIALTAPAVIILLIFSLLGIGADGVEIAPEVAPDVVPEIPPQAEGVYVDGTFDAIPQEGNPYFEGTAEPIPPEGQTYVRGHYRTLPDGTETWVEGHFRNVPEGTSPPETGPTPHHVSMESNIPAEVAGSTAEAAAAHQVSNRYLPGKALVLMQTLFNDDFVQLQVHLHSGSAFVGQNVLVWRNNEVITSHLTIIKIVYQEENLNELHCEGVCDIQLYPPTQIYVGDTLELV